jgi:hypothetical protein
LFSEGQELNQFATCWSRSTLTISGLRPAAQAMSDMRKGRTNMRAMRVETFSGYEGLKLVELPKPAVSDGKVLLRITAAGVTPLDHTILSGKFHTSKVPLVLGKGRRERCLPLWKETTVDLRAWLAVRGKASQRARADIH